LGAIVEAYFIEEEMGRQEGGIRDHPSTSESSINASSTSRTPICGWPSRCPFNRLGIRCCALCLSSPPLGASIWRLSPQADELMEIDTKLREEILQGSHVLPQTQRKGEAVPVSEQGASSPTDSVLLGMIQFLWI
jgi:hypothetical protein